MKRLVILAVASFMAFLLSSCDQGSEKKVEDQAQTQQSQDQNTKTDTNQDKTQDSTKSDESKSY